MRILHSCVVLQDSILKTEVCASQSSHTLSMLFHYSYTFTTRIRKDISAASFCSGKLLERSDECVLLPCFNVQPDIFAVMNCCVVALIVFTSDMLAWRADIWYSAKPWPRGLGVNPPPCAWYFTKSLLPAQRRLIVLAYILLVNLST